MFRSLIACKLHQVATIELLQTLRHAQVHSTVSLIQLLSPIRDIDVLLEKHQAADFAQTLDTFLHDTPFTPFYIPHVDPAYMPQEIFIRRHEIWHLIFWLYSQRHADDTCCKCLEHTPNLLFHLLFECDKNSDYRFFIFNQLHKLQQSNE